MVLSFVTFQAVRAEEPAKLPMPDLPAWLAEAKIGPPPAELKLDAFYEKHLDVQGLPVIASAKVSDAALIEAAYLVHSMLHDRTDVIRAMAANRTRLVVMAATELTTDIPEHSDLKPKNYWDRRARGLGATRRRPAVSCGEENLLQLAGDPYAAENILIHEFAHAIHEMGLAKLDDGFDRRLKEIYDRAMADGLWKGKYAATNHHEYWAEGVQSYFGTNRQNDHDHNHVDTRDELAEYDPELSKLIAEQFGAARWDYLPPKRRPDQPHLRGLDRAKLAAFSWPERLAEESRKLDEIKKRKQENVPASQPR